MNVNLCIPVVNRYDLLRELLLSLADSELQPRVWIINNGTQELASSDMVLIHVPERPMGVAESWNWFLRNVGEERIISNDDILFAPQSIRRMVETPGDLVFGYGFSCFLIRDTCVAKVGEFDELISPGYAYYEDCDYKQRIHDLVDTAHDGVTYGQSPAGGAEVVMANAPDTGLVHGRLGDGSQSYRAGTAEEQREHWRKHNVARLNFIAKHGAEHFTLEAQREHRLAIQRAAGVR